MTSLQILIDYFHNQSSVPHKDVFETTNPKNLPGLLQKTNMGPYNYSFDNVDMT
jgi:hypothetical protein